MAGRLMWGGACMAGGVHGGVHGRGHVWQGACVAGGMHGRGMCGRGVCVVGWACIVGGRMTEGHVW